MPRTSAARPPLIRAPRRRFPAPLLVAAALLALLASPPRAAAAAVEPVAQPRQQGHGDHAVVLLRQDAAAGPPANGAPSAPLLGYAFATDQNAALGVAGHVTSTSTAAGARNWDAAKAAYADGGTTGLSLLALGQNKPVAGVAVPSQLAVYSEYWDGADYPNDLIGNAFGKTFVFNAASDEVRASMVSAGIVTLNVWMASVLAMSEGAQLCPASAASKNGAALSAWDKAFALYAGAGAQAVDRKAGNSGAGSMLWALVDSLCPHFGTCPHVNNTGTNLNENIRDALIAGQAAIKNAQCTDATAKVNAVVPLMRVPLAQGIIKYAYRTDPKVAVSKDSSDGDRGAAWAYAAALLPAINKCNADAAKTIRENLDPSARNPVKDGYLAVSKALNQVHVCLGISCADLGGLLNPAVYVIQPCTDDGTASNATGAFSEGPGYSQAGGGKSSSAGVTAGKVIGGILAFALVVAVLVGLYCICCRRGKNIDIPLMPPPMDEVDNTFR